MKGQNLLSISGSFMFCLVFISKAFNFLELSIDKPEEVRNKSQVDNPQKSKFKVDKAKFGQSVSLRLPILLSQ